MNNYHGRVPRPEQVEAAYQRALAVRVRRNDEERPRFDAKRLANAMEAIRSGRWLWAADGADMIVIGKPAGGQIHKYLVPPNVLEHTCPDLAFNAPLAGACYHRLVRLLIVSALNAEDESASLARAS